MPIMRITITKYGLPQVVVFPLLLAAVMVVMVFLPLAGWLFVALEAVLTVVLLWVLSFFRDPYRVVPQGADILVSPADGTISDITEVEHEYFGCKAVRIGIFLSVFNVHINRMPCACKVEKIQYRPGRFLDARHLDAGKVNEANDIYLTADNAAGKLIVTQVSGAIARRIVCKATVGESFHAGEQFGMIKFGSRTELYFPAGVGAEVLVKLGDKVKAGADVVVRFKTGGR